MGYSDTLYSDLGTGQSSRNKLHTYITVFRLIYLLGILSTINSVLLRMMAIYDTRTLTTIVQ